MRNIDYVNQKPYFIHGDLKWYIHPWLQNFLVTQNDVNLPALKDLCVFVVKGNNGEYDIEDYVLINNKQEIIATYKADGFEQMEAKIKLLKISKHYEDSERNV